MDDPKKQQRPQAASVGSASSITPRKHLFSRGSDPGRTGLSYTPKPSFSETADKSGKSRGKPMFFVFSAVAAIGLAIGGLALMAHRNSTVPSSSGGGSAVQPQSDKILVVGDSDLNEELTREARTALHRGQIPASLSSATEEMRKEVLSGQGALYTLRVLDFEAEDGDEVDVLLNGAPFGRVLLSNFGNTLNLPLKRGETTTVTIVAVRDGQGGVTFGASSSLGETRTRIMAVGESETWIVSCK